MKSLFYSFIFGITFLTILCSGVSNLKAETLNYPEIQIDSVISNEVPIGSSSNLTVLGKGFDKHTKAVLLPKKNNNIFSSVEIQLPESSTCLAIKDDLIYIADKNLQIESVHVENCLTNEGYPQIQIEGQGFDENTQVLLIPEGENTVIGSIERSYSNHTLFAYIAFNNKIVYVRGFDDKLRIIDITNPYNPSILNTIHADRSYSRKFLLQNQTAYFFESVLGTNISIIDVSEPFNSTIAGVVGFDKICVNFLCEAIQVIDIEVSNNMLYALTTHGLKIIDVMDSSNPKIIGTFNPLDDAYSIAIEDNFAYITLGNEMQVIDINNSPNLKTISSIITPGSENEVLKVHNQRVYLSSRKHDNNSTCTIIDVSAPKTPKIISTYDHPGSIHSIKIINDLGYMFGSEGIQIINLSDISNPKIIASIDTRTETRKTRLVDVYFDEKDKMIYTTLDDYHHNNSIFEIFPLPINIDSEEINITDSSIQITPAINIAGEYQLVIFNPQCETTFRKSISIDSPLEILEIPDQSFPGNSDLITIPFRVKALVSNISYDNYTISAYSLDQNLVSNENIHVVFSENHSQINMEPNPNQFGTTQINLVITNGYVTEIERFQLNIDFPNVKIDSVIFDNYIIDEEIEITIVGQGFDSSTRVSVYSDEHIGFVNTGRINNIIENGKQLYITDDEGFKIIDITDYYYPDITGSLEITGAKDFFINDKTVYVACENKLQMIDIEEKKFTPYIVSSFDTYVDAIYVIENKAYITTKYDELLNIFDIQDNYNLNLLSSFDDFFYRGNDIVVFDEFAYITTEQGFLQIIDVTNDLKPKNITTIETIDRAENIMIKDHKAFIATHSGMQIIDISKPSRPKYISHINTSVNVKNVAVFNQKAYVSIKDEGVQIIDISDLSAPSIIGEISSSCQIVAVNNEMIFLGNDSGLSIVPLPLEVRDMHKSENSLSLKLAMNYFAGNYQIKVYNSQYGDSKSINFNFPIEISKIPDINISPNSEKVNIPFSIYELTPEVNIEDYTITIESSNQSLIPDSNLQLEIYEDHAFFSIEPIFNQLGKANIRLMLTDGNCKIIENCLLSVEYPEIKINNISPDAYNINKEDIEVTLFQQGFDIHTQAILYLYDNISQDQDTISNTISFRFNNICNAIDRNILKQPTSVAIEAQRAYITDETKLVILEISNPNYPSILNVFELNKKASKLVTADEQLYAITKNINGGIQKIDINSECKLQSIKFLPLGNILETTISNQTAYVAHNSYTIEIIDISEFSNPKTINSFDISGIVTAMNIVDQMLFIALESGILSIINVSNPQSPQIVRSINLYESIYDIAVVDDMAYVASGDKGLFLLDITDYHKPNIIGHLDSQLDYSRSWEDVYWDTSYINCNDIAVYKNMLYYVENSLYLKFTPLPQAIKIEDFSEKFQSFKLSAPTIPGKYALKIYNPQYEQSKILTFTAPFTISDIPNQTIYPDIKEAEFKLSIQPKSDYSESYTVTAHSGTPWIIPDENIKIEGTGMERTIKITPAKHRYETAPIHITVNNGQASFMESFDLSIKFPQLNYKWLETKNLSDQMDPITQITDNNGYTYQSDRRQHCIKKYYNGELVLQWGKEGNDNGSFKMPLGIAIDPDGFLYVVDSNNQRVQVFSPYGEFIKSIGEFGLGELTHPEAISIENDMIYVSDRYNESIQTFKKVDYTEGITKAIIVAGGGPYKSGKYYNEIWEEIKACADLAYRALIYQGLSEDTIHYISSETENELVDEVATIESIGRAITQWAAGQKITDNKNAIRADSLIVYLVDHGGDGQFWVDMGKQEILHAEILNEWLNSIQEEIPGKVVVIYDACYSGSFISYLSNYPKNRERIVITSSSSTETAYFMGFGGHSFSNYFWASIYNGKDIKTAFETSQNAMCIKSVACQSPQINIDGNEVATEIVDINGVQNVFLGNGEDTQSGLPVIQDISPHQNISDSSSAEITVTVISLEGISSVWAQIISSSYTPGEIDNPILNFPTIQLDYINGRTYSGSYQGFHNEGTYQIAVYAKDSRGLISYPMLTSVTVNNPIRRRAIIVMGDSGSESNTMVVDNAKMAVHALQSQGYFDEDIDIISNDSESIAHLQSKLFHYSEEKIEDIVLYMIGDGNSKDFSLTKNETLSNDTLNNWLGELTDDTLITIVYDAPYSYQYLETLADGKRILISSTSQEKHSAYYLMDGLLSFSRYFWERISNGDSLYTSYAKTKSAISTFFNREQRPSIVYGEDQSRNYRVGYGFRYGDTDPVIGSISTNLSPYKNFITIKAKKIISIKPIEKVVAIITPPDHSLTNDKISVIELNQVKNTSNYIAVYNGVAQPGKYNISICAIDASGNFSTPKSTFVSTSGLNHVISVLQILVGIEPKTQIPSHSILDKKEKVDLKEAIHMMQSM